MARKRAKKKVEYETRGNSHAELMRSLWEAAVNLRGSIEPADYKRYVLPLIFLRFLSLRYERRRTELRMLVREPGSEYYTKDPAVADEILEDADEYRAAGAYRAFRTTGAPEPQPGFCRATPIDEIAKHRFALTPGRYVGSDGGDEEGEPFKERMPKLLATLKQQFGESDRLQADIAKSLKEFGYGK